MSSEEIFDIDNVASDEEVNDHDPEVISGDDSYLELNDQDDTLTQSLRSRSGHQWQQIPLNHLNSLCHISQS